MSIEELAEIFTIRPHDDNPFNEKERPFSPTDILKYFSGLIITQEGRSSARKPFDNYPSDELNTQIRLVHFSLKEYLISRRIAQGPSLAFSFTEANAQLSIVQSCLAYLNCLNHWVAGYNGPYLVAYAIKDSYPLASYAVGYWMDHLEEIPHRSWPSDIKRDAASALAVHSQSLRTQLSFNDCGEDYLLHPYCYTAEHGHSQLTRMLIDQKSGPVYVTREELSEALWQMAYKGDIDMMRVFLDADADVNAQGGYQGSALRAAAEGGLLDCLKLLVSHGAEIDSSPSSVQRLLTSIKTYATDCLQFLLDSGADINMKDEYYGTALHRAIRNGGDANFDLLIKRGADVNALVDGYHVGGYRTPLQAACEAPSLSSSNIGPEKTVRYVKQLLKGGADPNLRNEEIGTALQLACDNRTLFPNRQVAMEVVQLLVENGTVERGTIIQGFVVTDEHQLTWRASDEKWTKERPIMKSAVEVVKLLLEKGAKIDEPLALHMACISRDKERVRWLLDQGADVNADSNSFGTPLHAVLTYVIDDGRVRVPYKSDFSSRKSLYEETLPIVQLLIRKGGQLNHIGGLYGTALQAACCNSSFDEEMVRFLLEKKADVNAEGGRYGTALIAACTAGGSVELIRLLLEWGANIYQKDYAAWNMAAQASLHLLGGIEVLGLLIDHETDSNHMNRGLATALNAILTFWSESREDDSQRGHERFRWLLDHGADVNFKGGKHGFALQVACAKEFDVYDNNVNTVSNITKFLLQQYPNINVNEQGGIFGSALQAAAFSGQTDSVRLLLDRGADVNARGGKCGSALNAAIFSGYWNIVEILLQARATPDYRLRQQPDEEWLQRIGEEWPQEAESRWGKSEIEQKVPFAIARYRKFWEVESGSATATGIEEG